jgi:hypothetical protein
MTLMCMLAWVNCSAEGATKSKYDAPVGTARKHMGCSHTMVRPMTSLAQHERGEYRALSVGAPVQDSQGADANELTPRGRQILLSVEVLSEC